MILRPHLQDIKAIGYYLGKIIIGLGFLMFIPVLFGVYFREANPTLDFIIGAEIAIIFGLILTKLCFTEEDLSWMQGMIVVSLSWLVAALLGAVPLYLSGHWASYLDSFFDAMSGFATTGLVLAKDLDHLSITHTIWRHFMMFIGGQGIVIITIAFFVKGQSAAMRMYVGEGRDEKILPNVVHTGRFIWMVSTVYLILGTAVLAFICLFNGMNLERSIVHGLCIFMAAFDTGGFTPQSQNILYYHSGIFEAVTIVIMFLGAINFKLHYDVWSGNRREILRNIETVTLFITIMATFLVTAGALSQLGVYPDATLLFRKGFYQLISAHTGTGYQTLYAKQFINEWGNLAMVGIVCAMALGGSVCSTTGAIKMLRVGVIFKAFIQDVKRFILPDKAIIIQKFHHVKEVYLEDGLVRSAFLISLSYLILFAIGSFVAMFFGYPFLDSLFESTSAGANIGLSCGITNPAMPAALKLTYIFQMWAGRLEFMSIFTLVGFFIALLRGKK
ncbi:MAG: TrkH family potassium uptake protein [Candidatus Omnitrophota bacterium]|jgi:trk system potassium uptake protein TrkH|nr:MAG: TrkH family potassium uptake protein [Candidatus Omnitrophota bacterium]